MATVAEGLTVGLRRHRAGDLAGAESAYRHVLAERPGDPDALCLLGSVRLALGDFSRAESDLRAAIAGRPEYPEAHCNLAVVRTELGDLAGAEASLREALRLRPDYAEAHNNLGDVLCRAGRHAEAEAQFASALALRPDYPEALMNLGVVLAVQGRIDKAIALYERALRLRPGSAATRTNLGNALRDAGRVAEAEEQYAAALESAPDLAEARYHRGLNRLMAGDFERGWVDHEWRLRCRMFERRDFGRRVWDGSPLAGQTILLHAEQGLGDTLQFIRYAEVVKHQGGRVVVECQPALCELLSRTPGIDTLIPRGAPLPSFDVHAPLMSLPRLCGTSLATIPWSSPYLVADPGRVSAWQRRLRPDGRITIGVAWQGNARYAADAQRSFPLAALAPIARLPGVRLISLQKGWGAEQLEKIGEGFAIESLEPELDEGCGAFVDTAAVLSSLDLVIAPDTALAHLAGGMGVPTWLALSASGGWRWMLGREDSPWYPTLRLFRMGPTGSWRDVFEAMARDLGRRLIRTASGPRVQISPGELVDRITILEIKARRIADGPKRTLVLAQLDLLREARDRELGEPPGLAGLAAELEALNESIWDSEERLRACEAASDFGPTFVSLARSVYRDNDRRSGVKREIDAFLGSPLFEVKSYPER